MDARIFRLGYLLGFLFVFSCTLNTDYFSEYRGKNLIENYDFSSMNGATPYWQTKTYGLLTASVDDYMTWALDNTVTDPIGGTNTHRLEIKNLMPNGDFEAALNTATLWTNTGPGTLSFPTAISNNSVEWTASISTYTLAFSLNNALGSLFLTGSYQFQLDFKNTGYPANSTISFTDSGNSSANQTWQYSLDSSLHSLTNVASVPPKVVTSLASTYTIAFKNSQTIQFDNARLVRTDLTLATELALPLLTSTSLTLLPGTQTGAYKFTVYVRDDATADQTSGSHVANRMYPTGLSVSIIGAVKSGSVGTQTTFFARPGAGWTSWTKLEFPFGMDFVDSNSSLGSRKALTIRLYPTQIDSGTMDAGSLYVSQPVLTYNP